MVQVGVEVQENILINWLDVNCVASSLYAGNSGTQEVEINLPKRFLKRMVIWEILALKMHICFSYCKLFEESQGIQQFVE